MHIHCVDEILYTTQYQEVIHTYVKNEYCAKCKHLSVITAEKVLSNSLLSSARAVGSGQCFFDPYDFQSNDEEYLPSEHVAETTPRQSYHTVCIPTAPRF